MNSYKEKSQAAIDAALGLRDDVYPCREDVPSDLWGEKIERKADVLNTTTNNTTTNDYERGYSKGFLDGFQAARTEPNLVRPNATIVPNSLKKYKY
jgi:hypothetical protein